MMAERLTEQDIITKLGLQRLDHEGGWFRRIHTGQAGPKGRPGSTTIYALFTRDQFSALHRLDADEQFFFLDGDPFEFFQIGPGGAVEQGVLGAIHDVDAVPHRLFPKGSWFGGRPLESGSSGWTLVAAVVTPGFLWEGFEIGKRAELVAWYPDLKERIEKLTRQ